MTSTMIVRSDHFAVARSAQHARVRRDRLHPGLARQPLLAGDRVGHRRRQQPHGVVPLPYRTGSTCVSSSGMERRGDGHTLREVDVLAARDGAPSSASELVRVSSPSRRESRGRTPVVAHPCSSRWVPSAPAASTTWSQRERPCRPPAATRRSAPSRRRTAAGAGRTSSRSSRGAPRRPAARRGGGSSCPAGSSRRAGSRSCSCRTRCSPSRSGPAPPKNGSADAACPAPRRRTRRPGSALEGLADAQVLGDLSSSPRRTA